MTLVFVDGFDHHGSSNPDGETATNRKWIATNSGLPTTGRFGAGQAWELNNNFDTMYSPTFSGTPDTFIIGMAVQRISLAASNNPFFYVLQNSTDHINFLITTANQLLVRRGNTTLLASKTMLRPNIWYYLELKGTIGNSPNGSLELRINGITENSATGIDTQNGGSAYWNKIRLLGSTSEVIYIDDLYCCNGEGSINNDFLGDVQVETIFPSANGTTNDFTPLSGSNFENVDETPTDDDTTYIESSTSGHQELYTFPSLSNITSNIRGTQMFRLPKKTNIGSRNLIGTVRSGGTNYDSSTPIATLDDYIYQLDINETDPDTGTDWTVSGVNSAEFGFNIE